MSYLTRSWSPPGTQLQVLLQHLAASSWQPWWWSRVCRRSWWRVARHARCRPPGPSICLDRVAWIPHWFFSYRPATGRIWACHVWFFGRTRAGVEGSVWSGSPQGNQRVRGWRRSRVSWVFWRFCPPMWQPWVDHCGRMNDDGILR